MKDNPNQYMLPVIHHEIEKSPVNQRVMDGYINATEMCKAAGKQFGHYSALHSTSDYLEALSLDIGIPKSKLIQTFIGRPAEFQGTWVHPQVAVHLAQWLSPKFAVQVNRWVLEWFSGRGGARLPDHVRRYIIDQHKIPHTHFSMLNQMILRILAPLENQGYILPDKMMPDISMGRMFSNWLRGLGYKPEDFPTYIHEFLDNRPTVQARLYPNGLITEFNVYLDTWLRNGKAEDYFRDRDPDSIGPLKRFLALPKPSSV